MKKLVYAPQLEEVEATEDSISAVNVWDDWGYHDDLKTALSCYADVVHSIGEGYYKKSNANQYAFVVAVYEEDEDGLHIMDVIEPDEKEYAL